MEILFSDWIKQKPKERQIAGILSQLLLMPVKTYGKLNPSCFMIEQENDQAEILKFISPAQDWDQNFRPAHPDGTDADIIFVMGMLLFTMLTGEIPDQKTLPLHVEASAFNALLMQMTESHADRRITRHTALEWLMSDFPSCGIPAHEMQISGFSLQIPENAWCFGIDPGTDFTRVSRLSRAGVLEELPMIPSVIAYHSQGRCVFGEEAISLHQQGTAGLLHCFDLFTDPEQVVSVTAADGAFIQETRHIIILEFFKYLRRQMTEKLYYYTDAPCIMSLHAGLSQGIRTFMQKTAEEADISVQLTASSSCSVLWHGMQDQKSILVIDAGESTDISLISPEHIAGKWPYGSIQTSGGQAMTEALCNDILKILDNQYEIMMYHQQDSGLNAVRFAENQEKIQKAARYIRHSLSFQEEATCLFYLCTASGEEKAIRLCYNRMQYRNLIEPIFKSIRAGIQQCLTAENISANAVSNVILTGGNASAPVLQEFLQSSFSILIQHSDRFFSAVRGAAVCAGMLSEKQSLPSAQETDSDLGIITADMIRSVPVFQCLLPAGTPLEKASCIYDLYLNESDLHTEQQLRLYLRPRGMEQIQSTLDPGGEKIRCIGMIKFTPPEQYKSAHDKLVFQIQINAEEMISAEITHYRRGSQNKLIRKLLSLTNKNQNDGWTKLSSNINYSYQPF